MTVLAGELLCEATQGPAVALTEGMEKIEPCIGLREGFRHFEQIEAGERLASLQRVERRAE